METILSIAGKPGLYKLVSRGNRNLIVEALDATHRRMPAFASDRVTSLGDIAMYTDAEDIPLCRCSRTSARRSSRRSAHSTTRSAQPTSSTTSLQRYCLLTTATAFTIRTSRSSSSGTTFSSAMASPTSRLCLHPQRATTLTTVRRLNNGEGG